VRPNGVRRSGFRWRWAWREERRKRIHVVTRSSSVLVRPAVVAMAVDTVGVLPIFLTGALAVQLRDDIGLSVDLLGIVYASYFAAAALLSTPLAKVSDRTGPEWALRIGTTVYIFAFLGIAGLATSPVLLSAFVALAGFGTALTRTATSVLVARNVAPGRQGLAFGMKHSSIPVGSILAGLSVPAIALTVGWKWAYIGAAALALIVLLAIPRPTRRRENKAAPGAEDMSLRLLIFSAVGFGLGSCAASSLGAYTVSTAVASGMTEGAAGVLVAIGSVVGLTSRVVVGHWSDRRRGSQLDLVCWLLVAGAFGFLMLGAVNEWMMLLAVPVSFATGWSWLGSYNLAMVRLNPIAPGAAVGVTQTGAFVGAIIGPTGLGFLAERFSFTAAWVAAATASLVAAIIIFILRRFMLEDPGHREVPRNGTQGGAGSATTKDDRGHAREEAAPTERSVRA
jgi:MFS family permease